MQTMRPKVFIQVAASIGFSCVALGACANGETLMVSICKLAASASQHNGRQIELHAEVVAEPPGYHLVDSSCPNDSSGLMLPEHSANDAKVADMMGKIMSHHARGYVAITGTFRMERINHQIGTLVMDDVLSVTTSD